jgi:hypothetical protein
MERPAYEELRPYAIPVCILAAVIGLFAAINLGLDIFLIRLMPRVLDHQTDAIATFQHYLHPMTTTQTLLNVGNALVFLLNIILFCVWLYRAVSNNLALGARDQAFTPGWSVGWLFIPLVNLVMGYRVMLEVWTTSHGLSGRTTRAGWALVLAWWLLHLLTGLLLRISHYLFKGKHPGITNFMHGSVLEITGMSMRLLASVLFIHIVWKITHLQREQARRPAFELDNGPAPAETAA